MSSYLAQWYDPGLEVSGDETIAKIEAAEIERLAKLMSVALTAQSIPRRLGADATDEELALDKRRCKRVAHVAGQLLKQWNGKAKVSLPEVSREAATVDWKRWWSEHHTWLTNRQVYVATWCQKFGADAKWCKSALVKLNNELQWLEYALRD